MKTRLLITALYIKAGAILLVLGLFSSIWWILTGKDFVNKITKSIFKKIWKLESTKQEG